MARCRQKPTKFAGNERLCPWVQARLDERYLPAQVAGRLVKEFPDYQRICVSHERIYQGLYSQSLVSLSANRKTLFALAGSCVNHGNAVGRQAVDSCSTWSISASVPMKHSIV